MIFWYFQAFPVASWQWFYANYYICMLSGQCLRPPWPFINRMQRRGQPSWHKHHEEEKQLAYEEGTAIMKVIVSYHMKYVQSCSVLEAKCWSNNTEHRLRVPGQYKAQYPQRQPWHQDGPEDRMTSCPRWCTRAGEERHLASLSHRWTWQREPGANKSTCQVSSLQNRRTRIHGCLFTRVPPQLLWQQQHSSPQEFKKKRK